MARKAPNFNGFSLKDIAKANEENSIGNFSTAKNNNANNNTAVNSTAENEAAVNFIDHKTDHISKTLENSNAVNSIAKNSNVIDSNVKNSNVINSPAKNVNQALFVRVKNYLYGLLGDKESVEVKFSEIIKDLAINPHSFYKYLQTLRETDFIVTQLRHSTEIKRR
jgi:hypothetical protein